MFCWLKRSNFIISNKYCEFSSLSDRLISFIFEMSVKWANHFNFFYLSDVLSSKNGVPLTKTVISTACN